MTNYICTNCKHEFTEENRPSPTGTCPYCGSMQVAEYEEQIPEPPKPEPTPISEFVKIGAGFL